MYLALFDASGEEQWAQTSDFDDGDEALNLDTTPDGGCILGGQSRLNDDSFERQYTRMLFAKADSRGEIEWNCAEKINDKDWITSVVMTAGDGSFFAIADYTYNSTLMSSQIIKYSPDGEKQWLKEGNDFLLPLPCFYQIREKEDELGYFYFLSNIQGRFSFNL